jgi:glycosyltransferase involved in cell wall biosynthesis
MTDLSAGTVELSVIVPIYRNRFTLGLLHERLSAHLDEISGSHQIVFVDDACPEKSIDDLRGISERDSCVTVVALSRNVGQHRAVMTGMRHALGEVMVIMDGDLQDRPEDIGRLVGELNKGYAAVFAGRRGAYQSGFRRMTAKVFRRTMSLVAGIPPDAGLFLAMRRQTALAIQALYAPRPFIQAMIGVTAGPLTSLPLQRSGRKCGRSAYSSFSRLRIGLSALWWASRWRLGHTGKMDD